MYIWSSPLVPSTELLKPLLFSWVIEEKEAFSVIHHKQNMFMFQLHPRPLGRGEGMANDLINQKPMGTSLVVQWIRLHAQGTINKIPHIPTKPTLQLRNPHALEAYTTVREAHMLQRRPSAAKTNSKCFLKKSKQVTVMDSFKKIRGQYFDQSCLCNGTSVKTVGHEVERASRLVSSWTFWEDDRPEEARQLCVPSPYLAPCISSIWLFLYNKPIIVSKARSWVLWAILAKYQTQRGYRGILQFVASTSEIEEAWTCSWHLSSVSVFSPLPVCLLAEQGDRSQGNMRGLGFLLSQWAWEVGLAFGASKVSGT